MPVLIFLGLLTFILGGGSAPIWLPVLVGRLPGRDPIVRFIATTMRREPETWSCEGGYPTRYAHTSGLTVASGYSDAEVRAPKLIKFGWRNRKRIMSAVAAWERRTKRIANDNARIAAIETIVGRKVA